MKFEEIIESERKEAAEIAAKEAAKEAIIKTYIHNITDLLGDLGTVPDEVSRKLDETDDIESLKKYLKLAAKAESMDEFCDKIKNI